MAGAAQAARLRSPDAANVAAAEKRQSSAARTSGGSVIADSRASAIMPLRRLVAESSGDKRMYRTGDGRNIELPPDMSVEQAAKLESEAHAAEKHLGRGPPPKPVPDLRKPADKKKKALPKAPAHGKHGGAGKGGASIRTAGTVATLKVIGGKTAQYLAGKAAPVLSKGVGLLRRLSQNEQTHDNAGEKVHQAEKAVVVPPSEGQSKSNAGQVSAVGGRPAPNTDPNKGKLKLQESLAQNVPQSIEDVDNFKRDMKAQHMGADVMQVVQGDKNAVVSTFADMEHTPQPTPPEQAPEALPAPEAAPPTSALGLGQGAVAAPLPEHTDLSKYTKEADAKLTEEGVTQEQLDMVDSGDLAGANKEKKGMEQAARTEPGAVQKLALQETARVDRDLKQEETRERGALVAKRKQGLGVTGQKQKAAKSALEKKRDEVAARINGIYTTAQDKVKKRLADLEVQSMKRFDDGNAQATKAFEDNVNREIDAFKDDRYSGFFGWARKAKDWLLGMDDLPEVKAIFDRNRAIFVATVDKLVADIGADNQRVVQECKDELARAKTEIKDYVDRLGPSLKDIGKKTAGEVNGKLEELDGFVRKKEAELQQKLADKQQAAIKAIDDKIEKMKDAMSGALSKLGKLLLWAAKKFFTWALGKFGYSLGDIEAIISKGAAVLKAIFTKPIVFVKNLMNAAILGFQNFGKNFLKHLKDALFEWLTGSLDGLVLPKTWDFPGIIGVALQMIGISYQNIRKHLVTALGEPVVAGLEKTFTLLKTLVTEGPMAAWEQLKDMAAEMRDAFIDAVKDFIKTKIIEQAIQWVVSLFIPGAGIIKAVIGIYDTVVFFIQKAKQIATMISNFLGSIGEIAAGNIGAAALAMENGLARGLSLVISFLAQLLHLNGITAKIRNAIQKIRDKVDAVLAKVAKWIADKAAKVFSYVKAGATKLLQWWKRKVPVTSGGEHHTLQFDGSGPGAALVLHSDPPPEKPSLFLTHAADSRPSVKGVNRTTPIARAVTHEKAIAGLQKDLQVFDEPAKTTVAGKKADQADALAKKLDARMDDLGALIGSTLTGWGIKEGTIDTVDLPRGSFTPEQKRQIARQHPNQSDLKLNSKGELVNLKPSLELARRHVVSSDDMSKHYGEVLKGKKFSVGKLLIEQRGSIDLARTPVTGPLGQPAIYQAAKTRYSKFFGYAKNLFIGDSRENSSIQQHLDDGHPDMADKELRNHVRRIKRSWAMDDTFKETPVR